MAADGGGLEGEKKLIKNFCFTFKHFLVYLNARHSCIHTQTHTNSFNFWALLGEKRITFHPNAILHYKCDCHAIIGELRVLLMNYESNFERE